MQPAFGEDTCRSSAFMSKWVTLNSEEITIKHECLREMTINHECLQEMTINHECLQEMTINHECLQEMTIKHECLQEMTINHEYLQERHDVPRHQFSGTLCNMAAVNAALGEHEKSKVLYQSVLATQERQYGQWYPEIATTLSNLAMVRRFSNLAIVRSIIYLVLVQTAISITVGTDSLWVDGQHLALDL